MATQFYQLRPGDKFQVQGTEYMKLQEYRDPFTRDLFNATETGTGTKRYILATLNITPADEYFLNRISEADAPGNVVT
jgi:hypothetical protein